MKLPLVHFVERTRKGAFTLVELLVSISVLALMVGILGQMFDGTAALISFHNKSMDVDAEARALLDRMAVDFGGMVKRSDVNYYLKSGAAESTYPPPQDSNIEIPPGTPAANPMTGGNDQMAFYSEVSGFYLTSGAAQSTLSLVGYRLNTTTYQMERYGRGLYWNGTAAAASSDQPVFLPIPLGVQWPAVISPSTSATDADYQPVGPPVFRFEYYYLLKSGALSTTPWETSAVPPHTSLNGLQDVAAIAVTIAAIDSKSRKIVSNGTLANLAGQMNDFSSTMAPGALESQWEGVFQMEFTVLQVVCPAHLSSVFLSHYQIRESMMSRNKLVVQACRRGTALVIVLAFILLLTGLLVAYLSLAKSDRQLAASSFNGSKVDQLATSALDVIVGDLKQEIYNGSTRSTVSNETIYLPTANADMIPVRVGNPPIVGGVDPIPNLVRISTHTDAIPTAPMVSSRASNLVSTSASANGRAITLARWNQHYLIPRTASEVGSSAFQSDPVSSFTPPDWVFVTREEGPVALASPKKDTNSNSITPIGRYAYAIYDEGGTLDMNVAGFPSGTTAAQEGQKGSLASADLTALGLTQTQVDQIVGWRNFASAQPSGDFASSFAFNATSASNYYNMVTNNGPSTGFMNVATNTTSATPPQTDQAFVSRQDLINLWSSKGLPPDVLQYLGTFSREMNTPSWSPYYDAATLGGSATYSYKSSADNVPAPSTTNPDLYNSKLRLSGSAINGTTGETITSYKLNGTAVSVQVFKGDPVVRRRFCLGRIAWLTYKGPSALLPTTDPLYNPGGTVAAIQQYFGLVWSTNTPSANLSYNCWFYTSPNGTVASPPTSIKTLSQVAALNPPREPDFFELLQASILYGSTGMDAGPEGNASASPQYGPCGNTQSWDQTSAFQILQIGANIIDQYHADNYPTEIVANFTTPIGNISPSPSVYGIKNLPYLYRVYLAPLRSTGSPTGTITATTGNGTHAAGYFIGEVWNPHQNASAASSVPGPTQFRFAAQGSASFSVNTESPDTFVTASAPTPVLGTDTGIGFSINPSEPTLLTPSTGSITNQSSDLVTTDNVTFPVQGITVTTGTYLGLCTGAAVPDTDPAHYYNVNFSPSGTYFYLEYLDLNNNWRVYTQMKLLSSSTGGNISDCNLTTMAGSTWYLIRSDPRTDRFSVNNQQQNFNGGGMPNRTYWTSYTAQGEAADRYTPSPLNTPEGAANPGGKFSLTGSGDTATAPIDNYCMPWQLSENRTIPSIYGSFSSITQAATYYGDLDGVNRRAEGAYDVSGASGTAPGHPLATGNAASRPIMLARPFRSVAEMGYAFRDEPWKNVNFFTPESADSALLDLFTVDDADVVAGQVNLNTRQASVLQALLSGGNKMEESPTPISSTDAQTLATAITTSSSASPFINRAELVNRFKVGSADTDSRTAIQNLTSLPFSAAADNAIKTQRESIVRALSDSTSTRTWNLMIDVIAQSGHFPPGSTNLSQFVVDGERRYWLHVAIDRYTGAVVDRVLEPVYE